MKPTLLKSLSLALLSVPFLLAFVSCTAEDVAALNQMGSEMKSFREAEAKGSFGTTYRPNVPANAKPTITYHDRPATWKTDKANSELARKNTYKTPSWATSSKPKSTTADKTTTKTSPNAAGHAPSTLKTRMLSFQARSPRDNGVLVQIFIKPNGRPMGDYWTTVHVSGREKWEDIGEENLKVTYKKLSSNTGKFCINHGDSLSYYTMTFTSPNYGTFTTKGNVNYFGGELKGTFLLDKN